MSTKDSGLGKGLDALLGVESPDDSEHKVGKTGLENDH